MCNFLSFSRCSWCLSDFTDKKPFCLSTANLAQAAASENCLVSMPPLRYLWAAMKWPKNGANFSWQLNAAPDGCSSSSSSSQCWNFHLTGLQTNPLPCPVPPPKNLSSFWLPAMQAEAWLQTDGKQTTLATCTALLPLFQQLKQISEWTWCISHTWKKNFFGMIV